MTIRFGEEEFSELVRYVLQNYGMDLSKKKILAECRLNTTMIRTEKETLHEFLQLVKNDKTGRLEAEMLDRLTTNYTYFFREDKHFEYLVQEILPSVPYGADAPVYRILSAGCSSGEECYTLAMCIDRYRKESGRDFSFRITGTDISEQVLKRAEEGRYPLRELSKIPESWRRDYCLINTEEDYFEVCPDVKSKVGFYRRNLMNSSTVRVPYDLIFCRNVMIYFDEETRRQLLEYLYGSLKKGGYLFVGHTELLSRTYEQFQYICPAVYRK